jgi:hypothetical protein
VARREAVDQQNIVNDSHQLDSMGIFVPELFHRRPDMKNKDSCNLRAILDYIIFLQNPDDAAAAIQRRKQKDPYYRNDLISALRDALPARLFEEMGWEKDFVKDNDIGLVVPAARSFLLELTERKNGEGLTGTETFAGFPYIKHEAIRSREGSSQSSDTTEVTELSRTQNVILEPDTVIENTPFSARSTNTTATDQLAKFISRPDMPLTPARRMTLPSRETRSHRRSLNNKRSASDGQKQPTKRRKVDGTVGEEALPQLRGGRGKQRPSLITLTASTSTPAKDIFKIITSGTRQAQQFIDDQASEILQLQKTLSERDTEIRNLRATVDKQKNEATKPTKDSMEEAIRKEKQKAKDERSARMEDENAVLRALLKAKDAVSEEELKEQLAKI